jgi:hypothetical protein
MMASGVYGAAEPVDHMPQSLFQSTGRTHHAPLKLRPTSQKVSFAPGKMRLAIAAAVSPPRPYGVKPLPHACKTENPHLASRYLERTSRSLEYLSPNLEYLTRNRDYLSRNPEYLSLNQECLSRTPELSSRTLDRRSRALEPSTRELEWSTRTRRVQVRFFHLGTRLRNSSPLRFLLPAHNPNPAPLAVDPSRPMPGLSASDPPSRTGSKAALVAKKKAAHNPLKVTARTTRGSPLRTDTSSARWTCELCRLVSKKPTYSKAEEYSWLGSIPCFLRTSRMHRGNEEPQTPPNRRT